MSDMQGFVEIWDYYPTSTTSVAGFQTVWSTDAPSQVTLQSGIRGHGKSMVVNFALQRFQRAIPAANIVSLYLSINAVNAFNASLATLLNSSGSVRVNITIAADLTIVVTPSGGSIAQTVVGPMIAPNSIENIAISIDHTTPAATVVTIQVRGGEPVVATVDWSNRTIEPFAMIGPSIGKNGIIYDVIACRTDSLELFPEVEGFWLPPTADDAVTWTPLSGVSNFAMVADTAGADGDTTYVTSDVAGNYDSYGMASTTGVADYIYSLSQFTTARKEESATRTIQNRMILGEDTQDGTEFGLSQTYNWLFDHYLKNWQTGENWQQSDIDSVIKSGYGIPVPPAE